MDEKKIRSLFTQAGVSENTIKSYIADINLFESWFGKSAEEADAEDLVQYIDYMLNQKRAAPASINRTIYALKKYYLVLEVKTNPAANLRRIKFQRNDPDFFDIDEINMIFEKLPKRNKQRNKLILILASICGLRKSEIINLDVEDFDGGKLNILGKGNKVRVIMLPENVSALISEYTRSRNSGPLFLSEQKTRISKGAIDNIMKNLEKETGLGVYMHKFRHTAATYAYRQSHDIRAVQRLLGHSSVNTTEIYVHIKDNEIQSMIGDSPINDII